MREIHHTCVGRMLVNDQDAYVGKSLIHYGEFSAGEAALFSAIIRPGMSVVDVGANIGAHTILFSDLVGPAGRVFAYEPQRLLFQALCANVALNSLDNVWCYQEALGEVPGVVQILSPDQDAPQNFGGYSLANLASPEGEPTRIGPLEEYCHFLKIDVEGMELDVIKGARKVIEHCRPIMYVENDRTEKSEALLAGIEKLGYTPFWHVTPLYRADNFKGNPENVFGSNVCSFNLLCLPDERPFGKHDLDRAKENSNEYMRKLSARE